jgi:hypothetical protein
MTFLVDDCRQDFSAPVAVLITGTSGRAATEAGTVAVLNLT